MMINQNVLSLDLAANTGWAMRKRCGRVTHGSQKTAPRDPKDRAQRWVNFRTWLSSTVRENDIHVIAFEQIDNFAPMKRKDGSSFTSTSAILTYGGYRAMLEHLCAVTNVELVGFGIKTIKKHWTGNGNSKKDAMFLEAQRRGFRVSNHDEADAIAILSLALTEACGDDFKGF